VRSIQQTKPGDHLRVRVQDGSFPVQVQIERAQSG
jgi:exonuclease VII large subunit